MWNENHGAYRPLRKVVVQDEKIGSAVAEDARFISEYAASTILRPKGLD